MASGAECGFRHAGVVCSRGDYGDGIHRCEEGVCRVKCGGGHAPMFLRGQVCHCFLGVMIGVKEAHQIPLDGKGLEAAQMDSAEVAGSKNSDAKAMRHGQANVPGAGIPERMLASLDFHTESRLDVRLFSMADVDLCSQPR